MCSDEHGQRYTDTNPPRCRDCGHRLPVDGSPPVETRRLVLAGQVWRVVTEPAARFAATHGLGRYH